MFIRRKDGSVEDQDGKVLLFSLSRFQSEIAEGDGCFVCGAKQGTKEFSDEHVISDWVLRDRGLHSGNLVLPNKKSFMYGRYVVPCCKDCNGRMAEIFEDKISNAFSQGYEGVVGLTRAGDGELLWLWMSLIFLKLLLKHKEFRWHSDRRFEDIKMSEVYDWEPLHHIHCVARSFYTGATIHRKIFGSLFVWPASPIEGGEEFDFANFLPGASLLLRIGGVVAFAVMNDSGLALGSLNEMIKKITGPLSFVQGREILALLCHRNLSLEPRPAYSSEFDPTTGEYQITADIPDNIHLIDDPRPELARRDHSFFVKDILEGVGADPKSLGHVKAGEYSFLFGDDGKFLDHRSLNPS